MAYDTIPLTHTRKANEITIFSLISISKNQIRQHIELAEIHCYWEVWTDSVPQRTIWNTQNDHCIWPRNSTFVKFIL